jgi:hypothetical protein
LYARALLSIGGRWWALIFAFRSHMYLKYLQKVTYFLIGIFPCSRLIRQCIVLAVVLQDEDMHIFFKLKSDNDPGNGETFYV